MAAHLRQPAHQETNVAGFSRVGVGYLRGSGMLIGVPATFNLQGDGGKFAEPSNLALHLVR